MPSGRRPKKVPIYFRVSPGAAMRIKQFLADYAGKPLYIKPGDWAEATLLKAIDEIENLDQEPPRGGVVMRRTLPAASPRRRINAHQP